MWQILTLEVPFSGFSVTKHEYFVTGKGQRPKINNSWSLSLINLMQNGWSKQIVDRPSIDEVTDVLRNEIRSLRGNSEAMLDESNRTAKSMGMG